MAAPVASAIAFLSDIHGNTEALSAVLDELKRAGITRIYAAGDHLLGGEALSTWRMLQRAEVQCARGVSEEALLRVHPDTLAPESDEEHALVDRFLETRDQLGELVMRQIADLPTRLRIPLIDGREILVVHGSPASHLTEISHDMPDDELRGLVDDDAADIIVCGASHVAFRRDLEGVTVVSVGSVGANPSGRIAEFTIMRPRMDGLEVHQDHVSY